MEAFIQRLAAIREEILKLKAENESMRNQHNERDKEISRLRNLIEIQNSSIRQLEQKLKIKRIADGLSGESAEETGGNRDIKFKINEMIKEVDKVISLMHQ